MVKVSIAGCCGRMGSRIASLAIEHPQIELTGAFEVKGNECLGKDIGEFLGYSKVGVNISDNILDHLEKSEVVIDFTTVASSLENLATCEKNKKKIIIGTTGLKDDEVSLIRKAGESIALVFAPNMSVGINLLLNVLKNVANTLGDDYDVEIVEAHHKMKKDAPSGTAVKMAQVLAETLGRNYPEDAVFCREGFIGQRTQKEIGIQTIRAGDIVGEHTVLFGGPGERIEITHKASSRDTFARGAIRAALWLGNKPVGLYDMQDVLGLK